MSDTYDLLQHARMVGDRRRVQAYVAAINQAVRPGAVVVDIGAGTGIFAMAACEAGARRVYAIEHGHVVQVAREIVTLNGFGDRVVFIEGLSTDVNLPELADLVVLDVRGVLPDLQIPVAIDAQRFLRPAGQMLPLRDELWAAVVTAPDLYQREVGCWDQNEDGIDMHPVARAACDTWQKCRAEQSHLAVVPRRLTTLEYGSLHEARVHGRADWTIQKTVIGHGVVVWFESDLADGVRLSNRPGSPELLYGQGYFPWPHPVPLSAGQRVSIELEGGREESTYRWRCASAVNEAVSGTTAFEWRQGGDLRSDVDAASATTIVLTEAGQIDRLILDRMAAGLTLGAIAREVRGLHESAFPRPVDALTRVATLSLRYA